VRVVLSNLIRCGYDMREINEALDHLAGDAFGYGITGFIERLTEVVPGQHIDFPVLERYYAVLPAGLYFVNRLIVTCEYAFWAAVNTPIISDEIRTRIFSGKKSYKAIVADDEFKLQVVTRFLEHYLLPKVEARKLRALDSMSDGATWDNYLELTCLHGVPYPIRLVKSLRNWLRYTSLDPGKQIEFERKLDDLDKSFLSAFRMVLPGGESLPAERQIEGTA